MINKVCGEKDETMYGFHWEYIAKEDLNKIDKITSESGLTLNSNDLSIKLNEIESMKYILGLKDEQQEYSYEFLKSKIDNLCKNKYIYLVILNNYLSEIPKQVKQAIDKIINIENNDELARKLYEEYLDQYQTNQTFKEYQNYIFMQRSMDAQKDIEDKNLKDISKINEELENALIQNKKIQLALLFNILFDLKGFLLGGEPNEVSNKSLCLPFVPIDFVENLPQLTIWVNNNKEKPIEQLTDDECKIIAVLMGGYYEKILSFNVLSRSVRNYKDVDKIIKNIPAKFGVQNITQVMFRIYLLKPHIWNNTEYYELVNSIKTISELVSIK